MVPQNWEEPMSVPPVRLRRFQVRTTHVKLNQLNPHLLCMLCGGYYVDATTIIECLHSFCKTCIVRYLESSHYCPQCDVQVHKTRPFLNIRPDKTLQDLVYKLVPGLFTSEMRKRREFYARNPAAGLKRLHASASPRPSTSRASTDREEPETAEHNRFQEDEKISLSLEFSPDGKPVDDKKANNEETANGNYPSKRYLLCPSAVTMGLLKKFVRMKLNVPPEYQIDVFHTGEPLGDKYTLMDIAFIYNWRRRGPLRLFYCVYQRPKKRPAPPVEVSPPPVKKSKPAPVPVVEYSDLTKDASLLKQHCEVKDEEKQEEKVPVDSKEEKTEVAKPECTTPKPPETKEQAPSEKQLEVPKAAPAQKERKSESKAEPEPKKQQEPSKKQPEVSPVVTSQPPAAAGGQKQQVADSKSHSGSKVQSGLSKASHGNSHHEKSRKSSSSGSNSKSNCGSNGKSSSSSNQKSHTSPKSASTRLGDDSNVKKPPLKLTLSVPQAPGIARVIKETVTRAHNGEGKIGKDGVIDYSTDFGRNKSNTITAAPVATKSNKSPTQRPAPLPITVPIEGSKPKLDDNFNHSTLLPPTPTQEGRPRVIKENNHTHAHTPPVSMAQTQSNEQGKKKDTTSSQGEQEAPLDLHTRPKVVEVS